MIRWISLSILLTLTACVPTKLMIQSNPPGAKAVLVVSGINIVTDCQVEMPEHFFSEKQNTRIEKIVFEKDGYRKITKEIALQKEKLTTLKVDLEPLDTCLVVKSEPSSALVRFELGNSFVKEIKTKKGIRKQLNRMFDLAAIESESDDSVLERFENKTGLNFNLLNSDEFEDYVLRIVLPENWLEEFNTPQRFTCTISEARRLSYVGLTLSNDIRLDGYAPKPSYINDNKTRRIALAPGKEKAIIIPLQPVITRLQVISDPPGAVVEDISDGGFGYFGETPLVHNFNWEDVRNWQALQAVKRGGGTGIDGRVIKFKALNLMLRISKSGYGDVYLRNIRIPIGEERAFRKNLNKMVSQINFGSDPVGVHVYVKRLLEREVYDESTNTLSLKNIGFKRHLGTTPFTLNVNPKDPIRHGEKLIYEKTGYLPSEMFFADGNDSYHQVMKPEKVMER